MNPRHPVSRPRPASASAGRPVSPSVRSGSVRSGAVVVSLLLSAWSVILAPPALAQDVGSVGSVTVEPSTDLPVDGAEVVVRGTGFDPSAGVYVAVCVDNGPGEKPTPCIGGADTAGVGGAIWVSDDPPSYAEGLTLPYGPDGSFEVTLPVPAQDEVTGVDCRVQSCAVTTRFDHLRGEDRRADHVIPVTFADGAAAGGADDDADGSVGDDDAATDDGSDAAADGVEDDTADSAEDAAAADTAAEDAAAEGAADTSDDAGVSPAAVAVAVAAAAALVALAVAAVRNRRRRAAVDPLPPTTGEDGPAPPQT